jgi:chromosome segregation ATPase
MIHNMYRIYFMEKSKDELVQQLQVIQKEIDEYQRIINQLQTQVDTEQSEIDSTEKELKELKDNDEWWDIQRINGTENMYKDKNGRTFSENYMYRIHVTYGIIAKKKLEPIQERLYILRNRYLRFAVNEHARLTTELAKLET